MVGDELGVPPAKAGAALGQRGAVAEHLAHRGRLLGEEPGHDNSEENIVTVIQTCLPCQLGLSAVLGHLGVPDHLWAHQGLALVDEVDLVGGQHRPVSAAVRTRMLVFPVQESHSPGQQDAAYRVPGRHFQTGIF